MNDAPTSHQEVPSNGRQLRASERLYWFLNGPLETNIFVLQDPAYPEGQREPYFVQTPTGTSWHPISQESVMLTPVPTLTIKVLPLEDWEEVWLENHEHAELGNPECVWRRVSEAESTGSDQPTDEEDLDSGDWELVKCCGEERRKDLEPLEIQASEKSYVTIHDFLTAVHPWLMSHRQDALMCLGEVSGNPPLPPKTQLVVESRLPTRLRIETQDDWIQNKKMRYGRGQENMRPDDIIFQLGHPPTLPRPPGPF